MRRSIEKCLFIVFSQENDTNRVCHITIHKTWNAAHKEVKRRNAIDNTVWHGIRSTDTVTELKERGL